MIRVLVVDDDFMVAAAHRRIVDALPEFTVVGTAHTGRSTLAAIRELGPDLVLLDVYLPDIPGTAVIREARRELPDVDFIVISAARESDTVAAALTGGIVTYLFKPFRIDELRARLASYRTRRETLSAGSTLAQSDVDRLLSPSAASPERPLPKGLSAETAQLVRDSLERFGPDLSAAECADHLGLSRISARSYLEHFVQTGEAEVRLRYGRAGRPQRGYRLVDRG